MRAARAVDLGAQREGVLDQLRRVEEAEQAGSLAQPVPNALVALHASAPDRAPVGVGKFRGALVPEGFEPLGFHADKRGAGGHEDIEDRMAAAAPRKAHGRLERYGSGRPSGVLQPRQRRQGVRPFEKEPEGVGGQRGGRFRVVEFAAGDFVAWGGGEHALDATRGNAGEKPIHHSIDFARPGTTRRKRRESGARRRSVRPCRTSRRPVRRSRRGPDRISAEKHRRPATWKTLRRSSRGQGREDSEFARATNVSKFDPA